MLRKSMRIVLLLVLLPLLAGKVSYPQSTGTRPLNLDQVLQLWQEETASRLPRNRTLQLVEEYGVDFAMDARLEKELRSKNISNDLINVIRGRVSIAVLTVECEPVECTVRINKESGGESPSKILTKSVSAGTLDIEVTAPGRETLTDRVAVAPGQYLARQFLLKPLTGTLKVQCEPSECLIIVDGIARGPAARRSWEMSGLTSNMYAIEARADGYKPKITSVQLNAPEVVAINLNLEVDAWARLTAAEMFDRMVASVGSEAQIKTAGLSRNTGRMVLKGNSSDIGNWNAQVVESVQANKQRWDFKIAGKNWSVIFDGLKTVSKGDKQFMGTPFGQELEASIRLLSNLRLPALLSSIQTGFNFRKDGNESAPVLIAESSSDRYTFRLTDTYVPRQLLHEHLAVPRSREELEYGNFRQIQPDLRLPYTMAVRYPDRPNLEQVFEFDQFELGVTLKESTFKP
jgi:hypothetical protein